MWYVLLGEIAFLSLYTIHRTPKEWFNKKSFLIIFLLFHLIGISSVISLLWFFYRIENETVREIIVFIESIYFALIIFSFVLSLYRTFLYYCTRHVKNKKTRNMILSPMAFWSVVIVLTAIYFVPAFKNADNIIKTTYNIESNKIDNFKIAMISDLHVGAGADKKNLDDMVEIINGMKADCLLICGDIADSSSSLSDLNYLKESLKMIDTTCGIYAIEGNHEEQCRYDVVEYLKDAEVVFLDNEIEMITDKIAVIGLCDKLDKNVSEIKKEYEIEDEYTIVLKHKPKQLKDIKSDTDLVLCGHTHGYQYPFTAVTAPFYDMRQGIKTFEGMIAITSSGLSQWGYHTKWPSHSEVMEIIIN